MRADIDAGRCPSLRAAVFHARNGRTGSCPTAPGRIDPRARRSGLPRAVALASLALGLSLPPVARGAERIAGPELAKCLDASGGVTIAMLDCLTAEAERQDRRLNLAYRRLMDSGSEAQKRALRDSQRAWLASRDNTCTLVHVFGGGGTLDSVSAGECAVDLLAARARFLEGLAGEQGAAPPFGTKEIR